MTLQAHIEALAADHRSLDSRIAKEGRRPRPDSDTLIRLKIEKLHLKEQIDRLRSRGG